MLRAEWKAGWYLCGGIKKLGAKGEFREIAGYHFVAWFAEDLKLKKSLNWGYWRQGWLDDNGD